MLIEHNGKQINTSHFDGGLNTEIINEIRKNFYKEDKSLAIENLEKVLIKHQSKTTNLYRYYFERIANDTVVGTAKWSINEALECDALVQVMYNKTQINDKVFTSNDNIANFKKAIDLSGKGYFKKPTQFPIKVMRSLLDEFTQEGDIYYDPCCGWGMRMLCAAEKGLHYVGNDVNYDLLVKLKEMKEDIQNIIPFKANLIYKGSQVFQPSLVNRVDFVFTSPPYFDLEIYNGSEGLKSTTYNNWLNEFIRPMLENCYQYIKSDKYVAINIKNGKKNMLYDDTLRIAEEIGFGFVGEKDLKQGNRTTTNPERLIGDSSEKIMILQKVEDF